MTVPILTIPESAFNPGAYTTSQKARHSGLLRFIVSLCRTSSAALIAAYIVGILVLRPLMATSVAQRTEFLESCRAHLRDLYLKVIRRVEYIPIVSIERARGGQPRKIYADSVCQTEDLQQRTKAQPDEKTLGQDLVAEKLHGLVETLRQCRGHVTGGVDHVKVVDFSLKDLRQKSDFVYFDQTKLFNDPAPAASKKPTNLAREVKQSIRGIKGMFMSGRA
ncbi:hypothetical protein JCM33374_g4071 [Metschnikowia sp. JCM 33374]|nr:hypothetical protein JCM33374_g4071 [Metschnikowia sp. JCM 33374]